MADTNQALLLREFMSNYSTLKERLARRLGSVDAADEALQEAYMRVKRMEWIGRVEHPIPYLFRIAINVASDMRRSEKRRLARSEIELLLQLDDEERDPERIAEARSAVRALVGALDELPPRPRAILVAARVEGLTHAEIAARFRISVRLVERELKKALDHCRSRLEINRLQLFGATRSQASKE